MDIIDDYTTERTCQYKDETYLVRDNGSVYRMQKSEGKLRKDDAKWTFGIKNKTNGYMYIGKHRIHIIVATAFLGEMDSKIYVVDHIDTNRCNNRIDNLRWLTRLENALLNENTRRKITYLCNGDIMEFINNPSCLRDLTNDPDVSWMRTVTAEEAKSAYARLQAMNIRFDMPTVPKFHVENEEMKRKELAEALSWNRKQNTDWHFIAPNDGQIELDTPVFTKAEFPSTALQKDWKTPTRFICCPEDSSRTSIQNYYDNLSIGKTFSLNEYCEHRVLDFALIDDDKIIIVATKNVDPEALKPFGLLKIYHSGVQFIHENLGTYFEENGVRKYFALEQGIEWNGPDCIDDYC